MPHPNASKGARTRRPTAIQVKVIECKLAHPDWNYRRVAKEVGVHESTAYRLVSPANYNRTLAQFLDYNKTRKGRERTRRYRLKSQYGITPEEFAALYEAQGGLCAICRTARGVKKPLCVDHDHKIEDQRASIRGLLCNPCNRFLGHARDDPEFLARADAYLQDPPARKVLGALDRDGPDTLRIQSSQSAA